MSSLFTYVTVSEYQNFQNISLYKDIDNKIPFGYHYDEHRWTYIYNRNTENKIGIILANNNYHNIGKVGGFANNLYTMFINTEYDFGTIQFVLNFPTLLSGTLLPLNTVLYGTFIGGTYSYYLKPIKVTLIRRNVTLSIDVTVLSSSIPPTIKNSQTLHFFASDFQTFTDVTNIDQKIVKIPFGYHYRNVKWVNLQNAINNNIVGKSILVNNYHNIDSTKQGGYCNNNMILYIEKEYPIGSISYTIDFVTIENSTDFIKGTTMYPTVTGLTGQYYGRNIRVMIVASLGITIDIYFIITPPI